MSEFTKTFQKVISEYRQNNQDESKSYGEIFADAGMPNFFKEATVEDLKDAQAHYKGMLAVMFGQMIAQKENTK